MANLTTLAVLEELNQAMASLTCDYTQLPEVKDKDGRSVEDVRDKRLALVRQHLQTAGDILTLSATVDNNAAIAKEGLLASRFKDTVRRVLVTQGAPPQVLQQLENAPGLTPDGQCDCADCRAQRQKQENDDGEPDQMGFGAIMRSRQRKAEAEAEAEERKSA